MRPGARDGRAGRFYGVRGAGIARRRIRQQDAARAACDDAAMSRRIDLLGQDELAEGEMRLVWVDGTDPVLVIHVNDEWHAMQGTCSHEYFELDKGFLTAGTLTCALHLSRFDITDGEPLDPPAELPLAIYDVVLDDGRVLIDVPEGPLEINE